MIHCSVPPTRSCRNAALLVALVPMLAIMGGCGSALGSSADPEPVEPAPVEPAPEPVEVVEDPAPSADEELMLLLVEGEEALGRGDVGTAIESFQGYLALGERDERAARALWGLSMALVQPADSTLHDPERAYRLLAMLAEEHPTTFEGRQARWLHDTLLDLERSRAVAGEQAALIARLTEMVEQLRQIDLNRRPTGGRPDSLRRPPDR